VTTPSFRPNPALPVPSSAAWRYGLAGVFVAAAWVMRAAVLTEPFDRSPFLAFGLAVLASALFGGFGPGIAATAISAAIAVFFYLPPELALAVHDPFDGLQLALFVTEGLIAAFMGGLARREIWKGGHSRLRAGRLARLQGGAETLDRLRPERPEPLIEGLSERELEIARFLALGYSNAEIAAALFLSVNTVKTHLNHLYAKLGVGTRTEAVTRCIELRLLADRNEAPEGS
jgi:DNA-binding CsgD family transcriptional regulator